MGKGSIYIDTQKAERNIDRLQTKIDKLEKERNLSIEDKNLLKTLKTTEKLLSIEERRKELTTKRINGSANSLEIQELASLNRSYGQLNTNVNKYIKSIESTSPMYAKMARGVLDVAKAQNEILIQDAKISKAKKEEISAEKELNQLRLKAQQIVRDIGDQSNLFKKGSKTGMDMVYYRRELNSIINKVKELQKILGKTNPEIQHFFDGLDWTELNNYFRKLRDEAESLKKSIPQLEKDLQKLSINPDKNASIINLDQQKLSEQKARLSEITQEQIKINELKGSINGLSKEEIELNNESLLKQQQQVSMKTEELLLIQRANNEDKIRAQEQEEILQKIQRQYKLEEEIAKLKQNPSQNKQLLQQKLQELNALKQEKGYQESINNLTGDAKKKAQQYAEAHKQALKEINAQKSGLTSNNKSIGETLKNFAKFTVYYIALQKMKQLISEMLDTMKDLDKAFTNIQLVTGDTDEKTAKLAQTYNELAKEMGATTIEVAEGARRVATSR